jgi:SnoaL-like protein
VAGHLDACASIFEPLSSRFDFRNVPERGMTEPPTTRFARAFISGDADAMIAALAPDATFHSPVTDYAGARRVAKLLRAVVEVLPPRTATGEFGAEGETLTVFSARDAELELDGVLRVVADADGRVARVLLWLRPLDALLVGVERMRAQLSAARARPRRGASRATPAGRPAGPGG